MGEVKVCSHVTSRSGSVNRGTGVSTVNGRGKGLFTRSGVESVPDRGQQVSHQR